MRRGRILGRGMRSDRVQVAQTDVGRGVGGPRQREDGTICEIDAALQPGLVEA